MLTRNIYQSEPLAAGSNTWNVVQQVHHELYYLADGCPIRAQDSLEGTNTKRHDLHREVETYMCVFHAFSVTYLM